MVAPLGKVKAPKLTTGRYIALMLGITLYASYGGYSAGMQPVGMGWRFFSYHPLLMTSGFVGMMGSAAITKKRGGYTNTKLHGIIAWLGLMMAYGGFYVIYTNKESNNKPHFVTAHSIGGLFALVGTTMIGMAGGVLLHPDFGIAKTNKTFRLLHLWAGRILLLVAWFTCFNGLNQLTVDTKVLALFGVPLLALIPFTLM